MKTTTLSTLLAVCLITSAPLVHAQTEAASTTMANPLSDTDKAFVQAASMSSSTEIDAGKIAMTHSSDKDVKAFARHMMMDHTKLTVQLKMAAPKGVTVPKDNSDTSILDSLKPLKGKDFDTAYLAKVGVEGHKQAVDAFQKEISDGQNADLKTAAQKALPTIQNHYKMAQDLATKKGVSAQ